jgi:hypothetical protein
MISSEFSTDFVDVLNMQKIPNKYTFSFISTYPVQSIPCKKERKSRVLCTNSVLTEWVTVNVRAYHHADPWPWYRSCRFTAEHFMRGNLYTG